VMVCLDVFLEGRRVSGDFETILPSKHFTFNSPRKKMGRRKLGIKEWNVNNILRIFHSFVYMGIQVRGNGNIVLLFGS
jgi:hypothetical protein